MKKERTSQELTFFAPAARASAESLMNDVTVAGGSPLVDAMLTSAGGLIAVLNEHRQLLVVNHAYLDTLGIDNPGEVLGLRLGEAVGCRFADLGPGGCGTSRACRSCGAVIALLACATNGSPAESECVLNAFIGKVRQDLVFKVRASPLWLEGRQLTLLFLEDVSAEKRRQALERTFLHDFNNLMQGLVGTAELLARAASTDRDLVNTLGLVTQRMCAEIALQKALAHGDRYVPLREPISIATLISDQRKNVSNHPAASNRNVVVGMGIEDATIKSDRVLLERILTNMLINALEASPEQGKVTMQARAADDCIELSVHNEGAIPEDVQSRIFQRYFSTKQGPGRGHGTYAMCLFAQEYLDGSVGFSTSQDEGTEFVLRLPRHSPGKC